jgi:hypothetical protein
MSIEQEYQDALARLTAVERAPGDMRNSSHPFESTAEFQQRREALKAQAAAALVAHMRALKAAKRLKNARQPPPPKAPTLPTKTIATRRGPSMPEVLVVRRGSR